MSSSLDGRTVLVTGIADENSLALKIAKRLRADGAQLVCAGLGLIKHQAGISEAAVQFLKDSQSRFEETVLRELGEETETTVFDASIDESLTDASEALALKGVELDGVLHAIAMDKTIRGGNVKPLIEVTRSEFLDCMSVSAYSLLGLCGALYRSQRLRGQASIVSLSYLGAERIMSHPYRNIGVAKAALERITKELASELGRAQGIRVNAVRFSPYDASRAGGAIPGLDDSVKIASAGAPLGNATPEALSSEVAYLMRADSMVTGEIRHVDGGFHIMG